MPPAKKREPQPKEITPSQPEIRDEDAIIGGPGQEEPPPEPQPEAPPLVEYKVSGRVFQVAPDLAQTLQQRERDFDRRLSQQAEDLRKRYQPQLQPQAETPDNDPDAYYETALFVRPREALQRFKREVINEVTGLYVQEKSQDAFWNGFYGGANDLDRATDHKFVKAIMEENMNMLLETERSEGTRRAQEKLAELTRSEILRLSRKERPVEENNRVVVEPTSSPKPRAQPREPEGPKSISDLLKRRREARRAKTAA